MAAPITATITVDPDEIFQIGVAAIQAGWPQWTPNDASYDTRVMRAFAAMAAAALTDPAGVPSQIVEFVGTTVYRTPPFAATAATMAATVTIIGTGPYTIRAGTRFGADAGDGTLVEFVSQVDVTIGAGASTTAAGGVTLIADLAGAAGNDLGGSLAILDNEATLDSATGFGLSTNGTDAETVDDYEARIQQLAQLIKPSVVLPGDFAAAARLLVPGVQRALAVDGLNYSTGDTGQERCVTVFPVDAYGAAVDSSVANAVLAELTALRETTFEVFVGVPHSNAITVAYAGVAAAGFDPATVKTAADAALAGLLSPATYGIPRNGDLTQWVDTPVIRYQRVVQALLDVDGFDHYTTLTVNGGTADVTLTGPAALPAPTITGTVT